MVCRGKGMHVSGCMYECQRYLSSNHCTDHIWVAILVLLYFGLLFTCIRRVGPKASHDSPVSLPYILMESEGSQMHVLCILLLNVH